jgi:hypothetical protein
MTAQTNQHGLSLTTSLQASEARLPRLGVPPEPSREIGFATIFLKAQNQQNSNQSILIEGIEIRSEGEDQPQPFNFTPQTITLKPLENTTVDIHLTNQTGYITRERVRAIVHCQLNAQPATIESAPVAIKSH